MYPHLYDFLKEIEKYFEVVYFDKDDRGHSLLLLGDLLYFRISELTLRKVYYVLRYVCGQYGRKKLLRKIFKQNIHAIIAIDHYALNWAVNCTHNDTKLVFWSHDFISTNHTWYRSYFIRKMLKSNRKNVRKCKLIIVQCPDRGKVLDSILHSQEIRRFYLPVSLKNDEFSKRISLEKAQSKSFKKINIMHITINEGRGSDLLLNAYQDMDANIILHFHGGISKNMLDMIKNSQRKPIIHSIQDSFSKMREVISNMDIGYVTYLVKCSNDYFVSKSTGQAVEFLRLGIPIITFGPNDLEGFVEESKTGVHIHDMKDLKSAINVIIKNYSEYSVNARNIYKKMFDIASYSDALYHEILLEN